MGRTKRETTKFTSHGWLTKAIKWVVGFNDFNSPFLWSTSKPLDSARLNLVSQAFTKVPIEEIVHVTYLGQN